MTGRYLLFTNARIIVFSFLIIFQTQEEQIIFTRTHVNLFQSILFEMNTRIVEVLKHYVVGSDKLLVCSLHTLFE